MENSNDVRYLQRFQNFKLALNYLNDALEIQTPDIAQKAGIIQFFELTFELSWKLMKDYLEAEGFENINSPRTAIKNALLNNLIDDGRLWLEMLDDRNLSTHLYNDERINQIEVLIRNKYSIHFNKLSNQFENIIKS